MRVKRWAPGVSCHSPGFAPGFFLGFLWGFRYLEVQLVLHLKNQGLFQFSPQDATITECSGSSMWRVYELSFFPWDTPRGSFVVLCSSLSASAVSNGISSAWLRVTALHPAVSSVLKGTALSADPENKNFSPSSVLLKWKEVQYIVSAFIVFVILLTVFLA